MSSEDQLRRTPVYDRSELGNSLSTSTRACGCSRNAIPSLLPAAVLHEPEADQ